jgi:phosphoribosylformylglycinamidine synthase
MEDAAMAVTLDAKFPGDLVYVLGETFDELGGSEYYSMWGEAHQREVIGSSVPRVDAATNLSLYRAYFRCLQQGLAASAQSVGRGGLATALAKTAVGGMLGLEIDLANLPGGVPREGFLQNRGARRGAGLPDRTALGGSTLEDDAQGGAPNRGVSRDDFALFSESQGRMVVTVAPQNRAAFEKEMEGLPHACIGKVISGEGITIRGLSGRTVVETTVGAALNAYRKPFRDF